MSAHAEQARELTGPDLRDTSRDVDVRLLLRIGTDLQLAVRAEGRDLRGTPPSELHVQAFDGDGNYLTTLAVIDGLTLLPEVLVVCRSAALMLFTDHL